MCDKSKLISSVVHHGHIIYFLTSNSLYPLIIYKYNVSRQNHLQLDVQYNNIIRIHPKGIYIYIIW